MAVGLPELPAYSVLRGAPVATPASKRRGGMGGVHSA